MEDETPSQPAQVPSAEPSPLEEAKELLTRIKSELITATNNAHYLHFRTSIPTYVQSAKVFQSLYDEVHSFLEK